MSALIIRALKMYVDIRDRLTLTGGDVCWLQGCRGQQQHSPAAHYLLIGKVATILDERDTADHRTRDTATCWTQRISPMQ